jgi:L-alanine-DL-glutamate epimerase-like enolase superfamily enzyme
MAAVPTIAALEADLFRIPLPVTLTVSTHGAMSDFELVTVRIEDSDGMTGLGYAYTVHVGGRAVHALVAHDLKPLLVGAPAAAIEALWQKMWWRLHFVGRGGLAAFAMAAIDVALWDLAAKRASLPLWRQLGGAEPKVQAYAGGIDLQLPLDDLIAQTDGNLEKGFRAIKMKVGRARMEEDVDRVRAMRAHLGDGFPLMVDANMQWSVDQAVRAARALAPFDLTWLEEPTIPDDIAGHVRIMQAGGPPIATGENLHTIYEFRAMIEAGAVAFPEPDLVTCGGITPWLKIARLAEAANLPVTSHGVHDLHVHLLAAVPNASFLEVHGFGLEHLMAEPLPIEDGMAVAPERPGHGVALDWEALAAHRIA